MPSRTQVLATRGLINPPSFLPSNIHYEVITGSMAYGVSTDTSDMDVYGFCIPPKKYIFPHLDGVINGFDNNVLNFEQFQQHHIFEPDSQKKYDLTIFSIVKFFRLALDNNPNMIDVLFVPQNCVLHCTKVGQMIRDSRKEFLHKGAWHRFKGYAYSQMSKMANKAIKRLVELCNMYDINPCNVSEEQLLEMYNSAVFGKDVYDLLVRTYRESTKGGTISKRVKTIAEYGYDVKFAYHVVRLLNEVEMILDEGDLDLQRNREQLKSIRRGDWSLDEVISYFSMKEKILEEKYMRSTLRHSPDEAKAKQLLLNCLEEHYGSLDNAIRMPNNDELIINELEKIINKYRVA